jgi:mannitol-1-phosphate 5-dehydrogenase
MPMPASLVYRQSFYLKWRKMKAVMYGAGNIGRGFIGALMSQSGYEVCFVDVDRELVDRINAAGAYTLRVIDNEGYKDTLITNIIAVDGRDGDAVTQAIAGCDLVATAVGARILPRIAPLVARGLKLRFNGSHAPLSIIICENLMDADKLLEELLLKELDGEERAKFHSGVGLVEASIGRMVPVQTEEMRRGDPLRVCVEGYSFLPVDRDAFKGEIPKMAGLVPYSPFDFYLRRKLYLHNMGHAGCAYLGLYTGKTYIYEAIAEENIELITQCAMLESIAALSTKYSVPFKSLWDNAADLLYRFGNRALGDSCAREGGDIRRKLAADDRLIGAARLCLSQAIKPVYIALNAAAALHRFLLEEGRDQSEETAEEALEELSGLGKGDELSVMILRFYPLFARGASLPELKAFAKEENHRLIGPVV